MRPTELIITNVMHGVAENISKLPDEHRHKLTEDMVLETVARDILVHIAQQGRLDVVLAALASAANLSDAGEIARRFRTVQEFHSASHTTTP